MSDPIREAAIEAAAKARHERDFYDSWDTETSYAAKDAARVGVAPLVDAVLAEIRPMSRTPLRRTRER